MNGWPWFVGALAAVWISLARLHGKANRHMAAIDELKAAQDQERTDIGMFVLHLSAFTAASASRAAALNREIAALQQQVREAGVPIDLSGAVKAAQDNDTAVLAADAAIQAAAQALVENPAPPATDQTGASSTAASSTAASDQAPAAATTGDTPAADAPAEGSTGT